MIGFAERTVIPEVGDRCGLKIERMRGNIYTKNMYDKCQKPQGDLKMDRKAQKTETKGNSSETVSPILS